MTKKFSDIIVYTDGGSRGNPGPAALGVAILDADGELIAKHGRYLGEQTNNYAEYSAVIFALKEAKKMGAKHVTCYMDSELVVRQLAGAYRVKNAGLLPLFEEVKKLACDFEKITFSHVRREKNKIADSMVNVALDKEAA
jgi:ribonuclease HI